MLSVRNLVTHLRAPAGLVVACDDVSFDLYPGEVLGIVGESGSGKSMTAMSILGLLPRGIGSVVSGTVWLDGTELTRLRGRELRRIRGKEIGVIFQDPSSSLNPVMTIGAQIVEALKAHDPGLDADGARRRAIDLLATVGIPDPSGRYDQYPHEFSGGMRQRAVIAMAIANHPRVLIADEPTTALDVTIQAQVLDVLRLAQRETQAAVILITHDLGIIAEMADRVLVMYAGRIVESGEVHELFREPQHPYTVGLLGSLPSIEGETERLQPIAGVPPSGTNLPPGCPFHPRCELRRGRSECVASRPPLRPISGSRASACHFVEEVDSLRIREPAP